MRLFLDTSVLLAAAGSANGASRALFALSEDHDWTLLSSPYVLDEVARNLAKLPGDAESEWRNLRRQLAVVEDVISLDLPVVFTVTKDRPVLFTALAWADVLLTLDRGDFAELLGNEFYGMAIQVPAEFLIMQRAAGRL